MDIKAGPNSYDFLNMHYTYFTIAHFSYLTAVILVDPLIIFSAYPIT
jgi:hypothetical protein